MGKSGSSYTLTQAIQETMDLTAVHIVQNKSTMVVVGRRNEISVYRQLGAQTYTMDYIIEIDIS